MGQKIYINFMALFMDEDQLSQGYKAIEPP